MNILWIVNTIFPKPALKLGRPIPFYGGWMFDVAEQLSKIPGIAVTIATCVDGVEDQFEIDGINYFILPTAQIDRPTAWEKVIATQPDVVHIHGTEFPYGLACMKQYPELKYVVSIQGLLSECAKFFLSGMSEKDVLSNITVRDILRADNLYQARQKFVDRSKYEQQYFSLSRYFVGRTIWDKAMVTSNTKARYFSCNESLRSEFYSAGKWDVNKVEPFSIFFGQAIFPYKGLHMLLKAISKVKHRYPDIKVKVAGADITNTSSLSARFRLGGYGRYLRRIINAYGLEQNIVFLGGLGPAAMIDEYLSSHIFVSSSSIENSSNTICEAQLLGVPVIASYVGGTPSIVTDGKDGYLYRFEDIDVLQMRIEYLFENKASAQALSANAIATAASRHDPQSNIKDIIDIYSQILHGA